MDGEKHTFQNWGDRLSLSGEEMTLEQAGLYAAMLSVLRQEQILAAVQDTQIRVMRMELFLAAHMPEYNNTARKMLTGGGDNGPS